MLKKLILITLSLFVSSAYCSVINTSTAKQSSNKHISIELGFKAGAFQTQDKYHCPDIGHQAYGYNWSAPIEKWEGADPNKTPPFHYETSGTNSNKFFHVCNGCGYTYKLKRNMIAGANVGAFIDVNNKFSLGIEGYFDWYRVKVPYDTDVYRCTNPDCVITNEVPAKDIYVRDYSNDGDLANFKNVPCNDRFPSDRFYYVDGSKKSIYFNKLQFGLLLSTKIALIGSSTYMKLSGGIGKLTWIGPKHKINDKDNTPGTPNKHSFENKRIRTRQGIVGKVSINTMVSDYCAIGVEYSIQTNRSKDKVWTYTTQSVSAICSTIFWRSTK